MAEALKGHCEECTDSRKYVQNREVSFRSLTHWNSHLCQASPFNSSMTELAVVLACYCIKLMHRKYF